MKNQKLTCRFHDPNPTGVTAEYILKVLMEVNAPKVEQAIREAMSVRELEEKVAWKGQEQDEAVNGSEELEEAKEPGEEFKEEEALSHGLEMSMAM